MIVRASSLISGVALACLDELDEVDASPRQERFHLGDVRKVAAPQFGRHRQITRLLDQLAGAHQALSGGDHLCHGSAHALSQLRPPLAGALQLAFLERSVLAHDDDAERLGRGEITGSRQGFGDLRRGVPKGTVYVCSKAAERALPIRKPASQARMDGCERSAGAGASMGLERRLSRICSVGT